MLGVGHAMRPGTGRRALRALAIRTAQAGGFVVAAGVSFLLAGSASLTGPLESEPPPPVEAAATPAQRVVSLMEANGCWSGAAPEGVSPTKAVVTLPGQRPRLVAADVGFGIWLEHDPGILHGFCR